MSRSYLKRKYILIRTLKVTIFSIYLFLQIGTPSLYSQCPVRILAEDLASNPGWRNDLDMLSAPDRKLVIKGHKSFRTRSILRLDIPSCKRMGQLMDDPDFISKLPQGETTLFEIASAIKNRCSSCSTPTIMKPMVAYLDDLAYFVKNFSTKEGFLNVISSLRINNFYVQDGFSHLLAKIRTYDPVAVERFEGNILNSLNDADGTDGLVNWDDLCTGCLFDMRLSDGTLIELKSYILTTLNGIHNQQEFIDQFTAYLQSPKLEYWFNGLKGITTPQIKTAFQQVFQKPGFYSQIGGNSNPYLNSVGIFNQGQYNTAVNNLNSSLYNFVKLL